MDEIQGIGSTLNGSFVFIVAGAVLIGLLVIGLIFAKLYRRASKEMAFVRTGFGGEKIIKDGGAIVLPVLHETISVNMNTLRIEVEKMQKDALITKDRMRVDVRADFYLRVAPSSEGISMAAQTLGTRTTRVEEVKKLMESKL
jgi:flotillin